MTRAARDELLRFDRTALALVPGARVGVGVGIALAIGIAASGPALGATMAAGALLSALPSVASPGRLSLGALATISAAMSAAVFVGSVSGTLVWLHLVVLVPVCLASGLLLGLPAPAAPIGTQALAAIIVFGRFSAPALGALQLSGEVLAGSGVSFVVLALTRPPLTARAQRLAIAGAARALGAMARETGGSRSGIAAAERIEESERLLARQLGDRQDREALRALIDVLQRMRLHVLGVDAIERRLARTAPDAGAALCAIADAHLRRAADILDELSVTLTGARAGRATPEQTAPVPPVSRRHGTEGEIIVDHLTALDGQLRAATALATRATAARRAFNLRGALAPRRNLRRGARTLLEGLSADATLASPVGRHAARLTVVILGAECLALATPLSRGYWVALTAALVLRPEFSATVGRGVARTAGTSLGVLLAGVLTLAIHAVGTADAMVIGLLAALAAASFRVSYALFTGLLTGLVVLLVGVVSAGTLATAFARLLDTAIGGALALGAYVLWPTWTATTGPPALATLADQQAAYLAAVLGMLTGWRGRDPAVLARLGRAQRRARSVAQSVVAQGLGEPEGHRMDVSFGASVLAALGRISLTTHALRHETDASERDAGVAALAPLADGLISALYTIADALRDPRSSRPIDAHLAPLRNLYENATKSSTVPTAILAECDELVDAIDTLGELVGFATGTQPRT